jgi:hypothetical protein
MKATIPIWNVYKLNHKNSNNSFLPMSFALATATAVPRR